MASFALHLNGPKIASRSFIKLFYCTDVNWNEKPHWPFIISNLCALVAILFMKIFYRMYKNNKVCTRSKKLLVKDGVSMEMVLLCMPIHE